MSIDSIDTGSFTSPRASVYNINADKGENVGGEFAEFQLLSSQGTNRN